MIKFRSAAWLLLLGCAAVQAIDAPATDLAGPAGFRADALYISEHGAAADTQSGYTDLARRTGANASTAHIDLRTGRFLTLMPATPLLPGNGVGNRVASHKLAQDPAWQRAQAASAFRAWLIANQTALKLNPAELVADARVTVLAPDHIQIYQMRQFGGVVVRDSAIHATIRHGNLVLVGFQNWADAPAATAPAVDADAALAALATRLAPHDLGPMWKNNELAWVPVQKAGGGVNATSPGLGYRLVHVLRPGFNDAQKRHEALVDALTGDVLSLQDTVVHLGTPSTRNVEGGVYPVGNDGIGVGGQEQADWPMPYINVTTPSGTSTTDYSGTLACIDGNITASLSGTYVHLADVCGASSLTSPGSIDFGTSAGTDCTIPMIGGGPGNTHASRTAFFELNQIKEMGRGQLPNNDWLKGRLTANVNIDNTCNATWNGSEVNFFKSGGGCRNTGEIAGVFDHEWGHGMDNNDGVPSVSSPGEGIADIFASLRLDDHCIGQGFTSTPCTNLLPGADPDRRSCLSCTGVRSIDSAHFSGGGKVFTLAMADRCSVSSGSNGPCGGGVHCEGQAYSQAVYDLWNRDLTGAPFNLGTDVARELGTLLTYRGSSGVTNWFACNNGTGGCNNAAGCGCGATSGYQQYLAADDDNGNLSDGTPHMGAIFAAFSRHGIACTTPTNTTSGCAGAPTQAPVVTITPGDGSAALSWTASAGATRYRVYRTDGVFGCDFGKILVGETTGTSFVDIDLKNGRQYSYNVVPISGVNDSCMAVASSCSQVTPAATGARMAIDTAAGAFSIPVGDGDQFIDNCETARLSFPIGNIGVNSLSNVRVTAVSSPSHPGTEFLAILPLTVVANQAACGSNNAVLDFIPEGLAKGDTFVVDVTVVSDQTLALPQTVRFESVLTEGELVAVASRTYNFESDTNGWTTTTGTFARDNADGGGASGAGTFYLRSSTLLDNQCDAVTSPVIVLGASSTLALSNRYDTEAFSGGQWWDRANLGLAPIIGGSRAVLTPSSGRAYEASGVGGACGMGSDPGWAGTQNTWGAVGFNTAAVGASGLVGQLVQLSVMYGTDGAANGTGFRFDEVTVTNFQDLVADTQSNTCAAPPSVTLAITDGTTQVSESGVSDTYSLVLDRAPSDTVTITINPGTQLMTNVPSLQFTTGNWDVAQQVTVTAVDDAAIEGTHVASISHSASGGGYDGVSIANASVTITDNDFDPDVIHADGFDGP